MSRRRMYKKKDVVSEYKTQLLLHLDSNIQDSSAYNRTMQATGESYASGKFRNAFYSAGSRYIYMNNAEWFKSLVNSSEFTIEAWVKLNSNFTLGFDDGTTNGFFMMLWDAWGSSGGLVQFGNHYLMNGSDSIEKNIPIPSGYNHFAVTLKDSIVRFFMNGVKITECYKHVFTFPSNTPLTIGSRANNSSSFDSYVDEVRISSIARWTSNFTPPTLPYNPD